MSYTDAIAVLAKHGYRPGTNATSERQFREARAELKAALAVTKSTPVAQVLADIADIDTLSLVFECRMAGNDT